jgi:UDP-N-acetylglucosamine 4,6-dehydratase
MQQSDPIFRHPKIRFFLGDVRDKNRLERAFQDVDIVIHAAALKQVPAAEYNPSEFIKTNVIGAMNVIDAAISSKVDKVIALSTDKASNPINLYGATKLCSDKLFCAGNVYSLRQTIFSVVRYGNVLGSRGSLVPFWQKLIADGATNLPITDPRMTRFWITLEQSVDFVVRCCSEAKGAEIFVPKIPSMKITELAAAMAPQLPQEIVGIRPGEKLHEQMISQEDARHTLEFEKYYVIYPEFISQDSQGLKQVLLERGGKALPDDFAYTSSTNTLWLSADQLRAMLPIKN